MGEVYSARDEKLNRDVAIKVLPAAVSQDADRLRRFEQEAQAAGALNHPNILAVYDVGMHDVRRTSTIGLPRAQKVSLKLRSPTVTHDRKHAANVPQRYADQAAHEWYAAHARTCFLSDF